MQQRRHRLSATNHLDVFQRLSCVLSVRNGSHFQRFFAISLCLLYVAVFAKEIFEILFRIASTERTFPGGDDPRHPTNMEIDTLSQTLKAKPKRPEI